MEGATTRPRNEHRRRLTAAVAAVALAASAWGWAPRTLASDEATFKTAYEAAVAAREAAVEVGFEWRDTKKMLLKAKKLAEKGEYAKAVKLAIQARRQGELGVMQAKEQETAWEEAVLK